MKLSRLWLLAALMFCGGTVFAQDKPDVPPEGDPDMPPPPQEEGYFSPEEMPDMMVFLPGPPDSTSVAFMNDVARYYWGKEMRNDPERAAEAARDAVFGMETILTEFEEAFGMKISEEDTPEIYKVLADGTYTCHAIGTIPKNKYMRRRPFMVFHEPSLCPDQDEHLSHNGSYPSGHTILGWSAALLMMEINPERATEILARGYRYGENRLVVGAHWQSDTDAGRLAASAAYARLHTSEAFLEQMKKAREEFARIKNGGTDITEPEVTEPEASAASRAARGTYTLSGTPATPQTKGIVVSSGQKTVKK